MPKYTLTYFDVPGRARLTRLLFALGGIEFEDKRVARVDWPAVKASMPLKQIPVLDIEGLGMICQSSTIERFVAKKAGLLGADDLEAARVDMLHTSMVEARTAAIPYFFGDIANDEEDKEVLRKSLIEDKFPVFFDMFTRTLEANGGGEGFFVGASVSLADVCWNTTITFLKMLDKDGVLAAKYPKLFALAERVGDLPAVKAWDEAHQKK